ncbi:MAG: hypothetical protein KKF62_02245 [Bacteroidetes bacterium]|nr:hypothetical protein [Bacteroidota bacterium]MBU1115211.1 hypothetical protein [Bacteroidota bacterium]
MINNVMGNIIVIVLNILLFSSINLMAVNKEVLVYEGAYVYKVKDHYYLYCTHGGLDGFQLALRSKNI